MIFKFLKIFIIFIFLNLIIVVNAQDELVVEPASGTEDKTIIWLTDFVEHDSNYNRVKVNVLIADNNKEGDGDGGKIILYNAEIMEVEQIDWEENCEDNDKFEFECILYTKGFIQWFNFVFDEQDMFTFDVKFLKEGASIIIEETGGMGCGAYFQSAQTGPYTGYPDGSGGLSCSEEKTFIWDKKISEAGGFPVEIKLDRLTITIDKPNRINLLAIVVFLLFVITIIFLAIKIKISKSR